MFDGVLKLIDRLIQLAQRREKWHESIFQNHIDPVFSLLESVHGDYLKVFEQVRQAADDSETSVEDLISLVSKARANQEPQREKLKALAAALSRSKYSQSVSKPFAFDSYVYDLINGFCTTVMRYLHVSIEGEIPKRMPTQFRSLIKLLEHIRDSRDAELTPSHREYHLAKVKTDIEPLLSHLRGMYEIASDYYGQLKTELI